MSHYGRFAGERVTLPRNSKPHRVVGLSPMDKNSCYVVPEEKYTGTDDDAKHAFGTVAEWCKSLEPKKDK